MNVTLPDISTINIKQVTQDAATSSPDKPEHENDNSKFKDFITRAVNSKAETARNTAITADKTDKDVNQTEKTEKSGESDLEAQCSLNLNKHKFHKLIKLIQSRISKGNTSEEPDDEETLSNVAALLNNLVNLVNNDTKDKLAAESGNSTNTGKQDAGLILKLVHSGILKQMASGAGGEKTDNNVNTLVNGSENSESSERLTEFLGIIKKELDEGTFQNKNSETLNDASDKKTQSNKVGFKNLIFSPEDKDEKTGNSEDKTSKTVKVETTAAADSLQKTSTKREHTESNNDKDEKLLKNMLQGSEEKNDNKVSRVNNFIAHLNNILKPETDSVSGSGQLVVNKNNMAQDVVKVLNFMNTNDLKQLTVKVAPKELGEIVIKLTLEAGNMKAAIAAHNKETYNLLTSNISDLTKTLNTSELKIQSVNINIYNEDTTFFNSSSQHQGNQNFNGNSQSDGRWPGGLEISKASDEKLQDNTTSQNSNISILA